jgi:hypothetical protein
MNRMFNFSKRDAAMKTAQRIAACAAMLAVVTTAVHASTVYHTDSLNLDTPSGGQIVVAVDLNCKGKSENFVVQTDSDDNIIYRGCAFREGSYVVVHWNDGAVVTYALGNFRVSRSKMTF